MPDTVRPLVPTAIRTEFGEVLEDASFYQIQGRDLTYVPGYSNLRRARDLAKGLDIARKQTYSADEQEADLGRKNLQLIQDGIRRNLSEAGVAAPAGQLTEKDVPALPVRLHWVRTAKASGAPDSFKQVQFGTDGYKEVTKDDLGQPWLKEMPAGAQVGVGGSIHQGDCVLMVCDQQHAARNAAITRHGIDRMTKNSMSGFQARGVPQDHLTMTVEPGREIKAPPSAMKA